MPVPRVALATNPSLRAVDMGSGGLLPEGPRNAHHQGRRGRKRHAVHLAFHVAHHGHDRMRLTGRPAAELQRDDRGHVASPLLDCRVVEQEFVVLGARELQLGIHLRKLKGVLEKRLHLAGNPFGQPIANSLGPLAGLAAVCRQEFLAASEIRDQLADGAGEIEVFGEPVDDFVGLRQRGSTLEGEDGRKRGLEERAKRPDDPHILLKQMRGSACLLAGLFEDFVLISLAKVEVVLSHEALLRR